MKIIICENCNNEISSLANNCVHCGNPIKGAFEATISNNRAVYLVGPNVNNRNINKIGLIKFLRQKYNLGLAAAKDMSEEVNAKLGSNLSLEEADKLSKIISDFGYETIISDDNAVLNNKSNEIKPDSNVDNKVLGFEYDLEDNLPASIYTDNLEKLINIKNNQKLFYDHFEIFYYYSLYAIKNANIDDYRAIFSKLRYYEPTATLVLLSLQRISYASELYNIEEIKEAIKKVKEITKARRNRRKELRMK